MAKVKYYARENTAVGTHSYYAIPIPNGTLSFDELLEEAMDGKSVEPSIARACVTEFMKAVKRNVLKGFRCQLGDNFLTVYPNLQLSVKDTEDPNTHEPIVATADMLNAANGKSRLGCTVAPKFSRQFSEEVSWQKVDPSSTAAATGEDDITDDDSNGGNGGNTPQPDDGGGFGG
jgi:hypothetical protein